MASGDVFADMYTPLTGADMDIQPAATVQVCITWVACSNSGDERFRFKNSSGVQEMVFTMVSSQTPDMRKAGQLLQNIKCFITNSEYLNFESVGAASYFAYSGIEI